MHFSSFVCSLSFFHLFSLCCWFSFLFFLLLFGVAPLQNEQGTVYLQKSIAVIESLLKKVLTLNFSDFSSDPCVGIISYVNDCCLMDAWNSSYQSFEKYNLHSTKRVFSPLGILLAAGEYKQWTFLGDQVGLDLRFGRRSGRNLTRRINHVNCQIIIWTIKSFSLLLAMNKTFFSSRRFLFQ